MQMKIMARTRRFAAGWACALFSAGVVLGANSLSAQMTKGQVFHIGDSGGPPPAPQASSLPATPPTSQTVVQPAAPPAANALPAPIAATTSAAPVSTKPHRAEVSFSSGLLAVRANDSSLNQILRSISRLTGMKVVGGVAEERVFGDYGPAEPATVLATLLDGTGTNVLLRETASDTPAELVLTPRTGGATPPSPYALAAGDEPDEITPASAPPASIGQTPQSVNGGMSNTAQQPTAQQPQTAAQPGPQSIPAPWNNVNGSSSNTSPTVGTLPVTNSVPTDSVPTPYTTPSSTGIVDSPNPPAANSDQAINPNGAPGSSATVADGIAAAGAATADDTPGTSPPNGTKTPEQIYQQLQQMLKGAQSGQPQTNANPATPTAPGPASTPNSPQAAPGSANPQ